jgi:hypothetical protein
VLRQVSCNTVTEYLYVWFYAISQYCCSVSDFVHVIVLHFVSNVCSYMQFLVIVDALLMQCVAMDTVFFCLHLLVDVDHCFQSMHHGTRFRESTKVFSKKKLLLNILLRTFQTVN